MATRISSNIRELEGTLIRVTAFANLNRSAIDMDLVQVVLKDTIAIAEGANISPLSIISATAEYYKLSADDITGSGRQQAVALARQIAMHICRSLRTYLFQNWSAFRESRSHNGDVCDEKISAQMRERRYIYNQVSEIIQKIKDSHK